MRKNYYIFNPDTKTYERVNPNFAQRFLTILRRALLFILFGAGSFLVFHIFVDKPSVEELENENSQILAQYKILSKRLDNAMLVLQDIQQRDDNLYRVMLDAEPISAEARNAGYGGTNRYDELLKMDNSELLVETTQKIDLLEKQLYMQIKSFDEIVALDKDSKTRLRHIPAIQPISNRDLKRTASGYGYRIDPVYNVRTFHKGMDFACDKKTPVYATADGILESAKGMSGYGYTVVTASNGIEALDVLDKADINVEYLYAFMARTEKHAYVVLRVEDNTLAEKVLTEAGFKMITEADINKL